MTRRSKFEIRIETLKVLKGGVQKPTKIMYDTNLSWVPILKVLQGLIDQGLVKKLDPRKVAKRDRRAYDKRTTALYVITQKGEDVLRYFEEGKGLIEVECKINVLDRALTHIITEHLMKEADAE